MDIVQAEKLIVQETILSPREPGITMESSDAGYTTTDSQISRRSTSRTNAGKNRLLDLRNEDAATEEEIQMYMQREIPNRKRKLSSIAENDQVDQPIPKRKLGNIPFGDTAGSVIKDPSIGKLWRIMSKIVVPSWVTRIPVNFGSAQHGKLKADQWRSAASVYLPLALTILFTTINDASVSEELAEQLACIHENTMTLLRAVLILTSVKTSEAQAKLYTVTMVKYLNGLKKLYPDRKLLPSHHLSLHLSKFLLLYGPVHGWWLFPFERLVFFLQKTNINHKNSMLFKILAFLLSHQLYNNHRRVSNHNA